MPKEDKDFSTLLRESVWEYIGKSLEFFTSHPDDSLFMVVIKMIGKVIVGLITLLLSPVIILVLLIAFFASL